MKNSKKLATLVLAVLLMAVLCSSAFAAGKKITPRIGSGHSETNPWIAALEDYFVPTVSERVAAETDYEIEWIKSYGGSVITLQNELQGIQDGLVDVGCMILVFEASRLPLQTMVYTMPFSCSDPNVVAKVVRQIYAEFPEFTTDYETKYNQKFIGVGVSDPYGLYSTKQIKSLEDVNGMKIGAAGINLQWLEGSGAVGLQTSLNDTYQNLQTNVCQATIQPTHSCVNLKVYEVAPYYLDANFNCVPFNAITVNKDTWDTLPEEVQKVYEALAKVVKVDPEHTDIGSTIFAIKPGDGSAREQAASCQRVLGASANLAKEYATKRYRSNCINWGMAPFLVKDEKAFALGDWVFIPGIRRAVLEGTPEFTAYAVKADGVVTPFAVSLGDLTPDERQIIADGCLINYYRNHPVD